MKYKRRRTGRKVVQSNKKIVDGIQFDSSLEAFMYTLLKQEGIPAIYEGESFNIMDSFKFTSDSWETSPKSKQMTNKGRRVVRGMKYTPDFVHPAFIIECKGRANETFPLRYKLFKKWLMENRPNVVLFMPKNKADCLDVIKLIKSYKF